MLPLRLSVLSLTCCLLIMSCSPILTLFPNNCIPDLKEVQTNDRIGCLVYTHQPTQMYFVRFQKNQLFFCTAYNQCTLDSVNVPTSLLKSDQKNPTIDRENSELALLAFPPKHLIKSNATDSNEQKFQRLKELCLNAMNEKISTVPCCWSHSSLTPAELPKCWVMLKIDYARNQNANCSHWFSEASTNTSSCPTQ